ncbi:MAG: class I SAM-dependent methyltransferase [Cellulosilyticaceae bacterium]
MKENQYDHIKFFEQYKQMARSKNGLEAAGEWHELRKMLPDFTDKKILDLGCGFGWHCRFAVEQGAREVVGIDLSERMLERAKELTNSDKIKYLRMPIEAIQFEDEAFDCVISSLALHYIEAFDEVCEKVSRYLVKGGEFVFSVEHPVFTAEGRQQWKYDNQDGRAYWPVDNYYREGERRSVFLGEEVIKYHRTLTTYIQTLLAHGFEIKAVVEPQPAPHMLEGNKEMQDELRRPMMLIIKAKK